MAPAFQWLNVRPPNTARFEVSGAREPESLDPAVTPSELRMYGSPNPGGPGLSSREVPRGPAAAARSAAILRSILRILHSPDIERHFRSCIQSHCSRLMTMKELLGLAW
jgi:hypothetical protein